MGERLLRRRSVRSVATITAAVAVVVILVLAGWVASERGAALDELGAGGDVDAVVALAGEPGRLASAEAVHDRTGGTLVISQRIPDSEHYGTGGRQQRCSDAESVVCVVSEPYATRGEVRAVNELATARGWQDLVVVTSRYHLRRAGLLMDQCLPHADVALVAADGSLRPDRVLREVVALGPAVTVHRAC